MSAHTPGKLEAKLETLGGYDCMSDAWDLNINGRQIAEVDLGLYEPECGSGSDYGRLKSELDAEAAANAERLVMCWNEHDALKAEVEELRKELDRTAGIAAVRHTKLREMGYDGPPILSDKPFSEMMREANPSKGDQP